MKIEDKAKFVVIITESFVNMTKHIINNLEKQNIEKETNDIKDKITNEKNIKNAEFYKDKINNIQNNNYKDDCKEDYHYNKKSKKYEYPEHNKYIKKKDNVGDTTTCKCCSCNNKKEKNNSVNTVSSDFICISKKNIKEIKEELQKIREIFDEYPIKPGCLVNEALSMKGKIKIDHILEFFSKTLKA